MSVGEGWVVGNRNRFGEGQPAESWWGVAGVSWHCGGGHMEGRLALWLPPACAPADRGSLCQEEGRDSNRERGETWVVFVAYCSEFDAAGNALK